MPWYRTGTVSVTNNSTTVTGAGTDFSANSRVGDAFQGPDGGWYEVTNIASTTVISILPAYQGATASGGVYGLAPMQGYVKQSADQLRAITNQYGTTLGILGTPSNATQLRTNILAAKSGANSDITSITGLTTALGISQGGTGATSQSSARTALGLGSAAVAPILGAVSQSGGTPTGAIIERGNNANGEYVKFADGTMFCSRKFAINITTTATGAIFRDNAPVGGVWTYPAVFSGNPALATVATSSIVWSSVAAADATSASIVVLSPVNLSSAGSFLHTLAFGRWF